MNLQKIERSAYRVMLLVLAGLLVLGNIGRIPLSDKIVIYLQDILLMCMAGFVLIHAREAIGMLRKQTWIKPFVIFVCMIGISLGVAFVRSEQQIVIGAAYALRYFLYFSVFPYMLLGLRRKYIVEKQLMLGMIGIALGVGVLGLVQYVFLPDVRFLFLLGYDDHYFRLVSTYFDPPFTAQLLIIGLFILLGQKSRSKKTWVSWVVLFISLLLTYSRAQYVAFLAGVVSVLVLSGKKSVLFIFALLAVGIVLLPRPASEGARLERTQSIVARATGLMERVNKLDTQTLLIGNGWYLSNADRVPRSGVTTSHSSSSDNSYFQVLESLGVVGLVAFLWFLWKVVVQYKQHSIVLPILISIGVGSLANNIVFYPAVMIFFWTLLTVHAQPTK